MERSEFLARIRSSIDASRLPPAPVADPGLLVPRLPEVDLVERFGRALAAVDGTLHRGDPEQAVRDILAMHDAGPYLAWDPGLLPVPGVLGVLEGAGCRRLDPIVPAEGRRRHQAGFAEAHLGVTGAEAAFAESGSIVVRSGPGRPRMASLVPLVHVVLVETDRIHRSLAHWAAAGAGTMADASNVVFVTGPSRTADIEQQLNLGVHGPRSVHVVLVD